jgi:hypothetical protein
VTAVAAALACIAGGAVGAAGCGGPIQPDELGRGIETLGAIASEGRLLAQGVEDDRSKNTFVRVHARNLADEADHEAEKLTDAEATGNVADVRDDAVKLAQSISGALGDLSVSPGDPETARKAEADLKDAFTRADYLGGKL